MKNISLENTAVFLLAAIIIVALGSFAGGVNEYVAVNNLQNQTASVVLSQQQPSANTQANQAEPLVLLVANPGIVAEGDTATLTWTISNDSVVRCASVSDPVDPLWYGEKTATRGVHAQETSPITEEKTYVIQCIDQNNQTSISSMNIAVIQ